MSFGVGASIGPLAVGALIAPLGGNILYAFFSLCGLSLIAFSRTVKQDQDEFVNDAPVPHMAIPDSLVSSPLSPALNPSFDEQLIHDIMPPPDQTETELGENASEDEPQQQ